MGEGQNAKTTAENSKKLKKQLKALRGEFSLVPTLACDMPMGSRCIVLQDYHCCAFPAKVYRICELSTFDVCQAQIVFLERRYII